MARHAQDLPALARACVNLEYGQAAELGRDIGGDANLARPLTGDATELNALVPEAFFTLQDQLRVEARAVAEAAARQDGEALAGAYGRLSATCVRCHAAFRKPRP